MQKQQHVAAAVQQLLANVAGVTFAQVQYVSRVPVAAKHKASVVIEKRVNANVQLFNNLQAFTSVYENAVKRSAAQYASNDASDVQAFAAQGNYYTHTGCYSIVQHKTQDKLYLYCIYNSAQSTYYINGEVATKQQVAAYLTPSEAAKLLNNTDVVRNVTHNITHNVKVRTIELNNIVSINANKQQLVF